MTLKTAPLSVTCVLAIVYEELVAPLIGESFRYHCNVGVGAPLATTVNVTLCNSIANWDCGCVTIVAGSFVISNSSSLIPVMPYPLIPAEEPAGTAPVYCSQVTEKLPDASASIFRCRTGGFFGGN